MIAATLYTYETWYSDEDGYHVNDVFRQDSIELDLDEPGDLSEWVLFWVKADKWADIDHAVGDDYWYELIDTRDDKPLGRVVITKL